MHRYASRWLRRRGKWQDESRGCFRLSKRCAVLALQPEASDQAHANGLPFAGQSVKGDADIPASEDRMKGRTLGLAALAILISLTGAYAQNNLDAGKPPGRLFAETCAACHKSPRGLLKSVSSSGLPGFLRQHYTTGPEMASALAGYLMASGAAEHVPDPPARAQKQAKDGAEPSAKQKRLFSPASRRPRRRARPARTRWPNPGQRQSQKRSPTQVPSPDQSPRPTPRANRRRQNRKSRPRLPVRRSPRQPSLRNPRHQNRIRSDPIRHRPSLRQIRPGPTRNAPVRTTLRVPMPLRQRRQRSRHRAGCLVRPD